jgi:hypothetical protein
MSAHIAADLGQAARRIATSLVVSDAIDRYFADRDLDVDARDVYKALHEAAEAAVSL